jgi:hypothetical protein
MTLKIILAASGVIWLVICVSLYKLSKDTAWLAGLTVATCLFFLGATVIASFLVIRALFLSPLWLGILILSLLHLSAAKQESIGTRPYRSTPIQISAESSDLAEDSREGTYI